MKLLERIVTKHPWPVIAVVLAVTAVFAWQATGVKQSTDLEENYPRSDPRVAAYLEVNEKFNQQDAIILFLTGEDIFSAKSLRTVLRITDRLLAIERLRRVTSLTNVTDFRGDEEGIRSDLLIPELPEDREEAEALRRKILSDPWYTGRLVSADGRSTIVVAEPVSLGRFEERVDLLKEMRAAVAEVQGDLEVAFAGSIVMDQEGSEYLNKDLAVLLLLVLMLILAILFVTFRLLRGVVLPAITVLMSIVWTIGLMALLDRPMSTISNIMPILLIGVGSAYGIHVIARFQEGVRRGVDRVGAVTTALGHTGIGVWLAALTTMVGFGSLVFSRLQLIRDFGLFSAFGVLVAFLISLTLIPACLILLREPRAARGGSGTNVRAGAAEGALRRLADFVIKGDSLILGVGVVLIAVGLLGWARLDTAIDPAGLLPEGSGTRQVEELVDESFGGSAQFNILVRGDLNDPPILKTIERFQMEMEEAGTGKPVSVVSLLSRLNRALHGGDPQHDTIPEDPALVSQLLFLLSISVSPEDLAALMSFDQTEALITAPVSYLADFGTRAQIARTLEAKATALFGDKAEVLVTGTPVVEMALVDIINEEQVQNIVTSLAAVMTIVFAAFRSIGVGFGCVGPIVLTIISSFGLMGWAGIPLDFATVMISSLATGMGIDYAIHFFHRYREERGRGLPMDEAIVETIRNTGPAIMANALAVGAGFAILLFSRFSIFRNFGGMIAFTMIMTAFGALTIVPAAIRLHARLGTVLAGRRALQSPKDNP
ncbi:MAG: MMPL family transporter [Bacillota bacterium]